MLETLLVDKKPYEASFLLSDEASKGEVDALLKSINAEIVTQSPLVATKFAYPVKKHANGFFGYVHFRATTEEAAKFKEILNTNQKILRSLLVTPPIIVAPREPRPERKQGTAAALISTAPEVRPSAPQETAMSNEALEKKLAEILK